MVRSDWDGLVARKRRATADVALTAPLRPGTIGGSGAFLGLANDTRRYWIKPLNNLQGPRVPITEQIVGRAAALLGPACCEVCTIEIPDTAEGWAFRPGAILQRGIAHACLHVEDAVDAPWLSHPHEDDNAHRHARLLALFDWCWGGDAQGLTAMADEHRFYSHDHGWYLPPEGPRWTAAEIEAQVDASRVFPVGGTAVTAAIADEIAQTLIAITREQLVSVLCSIPSTWPVDDDELAGC